MNINAFNRGCVIIDLRKVLSHFNKDNVRSTVAIVTGIVRKICIKQYTSDSIVLLVSISFIMLQMVYTLVTVLI